MCEAQAATPSNAALNRCSDSRRDASIKLIVAPAWAIILCAVASSFSICSPDNVTDDGFVFETVGSDELRGGSFAVELVVLADTLAETPSLVAVAALRVLPLDTFAALLGLRVVDPVDALLLGTVRFPVALVTPAH